MPSIVAYAPNGDLDVIARERNAENMRVAKDAYDKGNMRTGSLVLGPAISGIPVRPQIPKSYGRAALSPHSGTDGCGIGVMMGTGY